MSGRRRSNIPIPSFAPPQRGNDQASGNASKKANKQRKSQLEMTETKDEVAGRIRIPVNEQVMIRLESALQLHRHQQRQQQQQQQQQKQQQQKQQQQKQQQQASPNKGHRISFRDFCAIASRIDTAIADATGDASAAEETIGEGNGNDPIAPTDSNQFQKDLTEDSLGLWKLSKEERLWHDLYCIAVPALYRASDGSPNDNDALDRGEPNQTSGNGNDNDNEKHKNKNKKRGRIIAAAARLTLTTTSVRSSDGAGSGSGSSSGNGNGSRLTELRRLSREAKTCGIPKARSDRAFGLLLTLQRETTRYGESTARKTGGTTVSVANGSSSSSSKENASKRQQQQQPQRQHKPSTADVLLRDPKVSTAASDKDNNDDTHNENNSGPGKNRNGKTPSTIDDRIRARAQERERNLEQAKAARKDPREERVAVADALYSYACHVLRRKRSRSRSSLRGSDRFATAKRGASATTTTTTTTTAAAAATIPSSRCSVSFREVVQQGLANRSRTDITRLFLDIRQVLASSSLSSSSSAPITFLRWKDPKTGQSNTVPIAKNATVWIDTADFKRVREVLNRERTPNHVAEGKVEERKKRSASARNTNEKRSKTPTKKARPS